MRIYQFNRLSSTQDEARAFIRRESPADSVMIVAHEQTDGYGRFKRPFYSPQNGLYFTLVIPLEVVTCSLPLVTHATAVTMYERLGKLTAQEIKIKWVNDLYVGTSKVGGILIEQIHTDEQDYLLIGSGTNIRPQSIPAALQSKMGTLDYQHIELPEGWLKSVGDAIVRAVQSSDAWIIEHYRANCMLIGYQVTAQVGHETIQGQAMDITNEGGLVIRTAEQQRVLYTGEITRLILASGENT